MKTWTLQFKDGRTIAVKALKADYENLRYRLNDLMRVGNACRELLGEKPDNETPEQYAEAVKNSCIMVSMFGSVQTPQAALDFIAALPVAIDTEMCNRLTAEAGKLYSSLVPIVDKRETKAVRQEWQAEHARLESERKEKHLREFVDVYCASREFVEIPAGQMAVCLELTFDDSHMMSDYFHPHVGIGEKMLLAIVSKQAERQELARRVMAQYPELSALAWTWHTENYSMGHGNYLMSEWLPDELPHQAYDGRKSVQVRWEISFWSHEKNLRAYKGYPGNAPKVEESATNGANGVQVRLNAEKNGVEVLFSEKPEQAVIASLKSRGFRWSPAGKLWYAKQSPDKIIFANSLAA